MKVEIKLNPNIKETTVTINTREITNEIKQLSKKIENIDNQKIMAWKEKELYLLTSKQIESIYSSNGKVYIKTKTEEYTSKNKLYELEERIENKSFIRVSNSEIINFDELKSIDLGIIGTIKLNLKSGYSTYVSRRNIRKIKEYLKI